MTLSRPVCPLYLHHSITLPLKSPYFPESGNEITSNVPCLAFATLGMLDQASSSFSYRSSVLSVLNFGGSFTYDSGILFGYCLDKVPIPGILGGRSQTYSRSSFTRVHTTGPSSFRNEISLAGIGPPLDLYYSATI